jgi:hypothetical protein
VQLKFITYCFIIWAASTSCVSPYEFKGTERSSFLVVDGRITQQDKYNSLRLSWSTPYGDVANLSPVDNAEIKIYNSKGEQGSYYNLGDGFYDQLPGQELLGVPGESYYIEITLGNKVYRSVPETMPDVVVPDSVSVKFSYKSILNENDKIITYPNIDVLVSTPVNRSGQENYLRWKTDEMFSFFERQCSPLHVPKVCYTRRETDAEKIFIFSGEKLTEGYLPLHNIGSKRINNGYEFVYRHYYNVYQYSITKEAFDFWNRIEKITAPKGNIFDLPPATIHGNIYNVDDEDELVGGYFEAASLGIARKFIYADDLLPYIIEPRYTYCGTGICCNCLLINGAATEKPDYWE